jgi:hypothetical protein
VLVLAVSTLTVRDGTRAGTCWREACFRGWWWWITAM